MRGALIQSGICWLTTLLSLYTLAVLGYDPVTAAALIILAICLIAILFYPKRTILSGALTGGLAGTLNLPSTIGFGYQSLGFLIGALILATLASLLYLVVFLLSDRFKLQDFYGNGAVIPLIAFLANLLFLALAKYALGYDNIIFIHQEGLFFGTDAWHFLAIPVAFLAAWLGYKFNRQSESAYNQYGLSLITSLILIGGLTLTYLPFHGPELALVWLAALLIGTTRLPQYGSVVQYLAAAALFGLFYILLRNLFGPIPLFVGLQAFLATWIVQKITPTTQPTLQSDQKEPASKPKAGNLASIEAYYETKT
jgi:hypothetical protein